MSSSAEFPDWSVFSEREAPFDSELLSPASEVAAVLQWSHAALDEAQQAVEDVRREGLMALAEQAVLVVQLAAALDRYAPDFTQASLTNVQRSLRIVKDQMLAAVNRAGLEIGVPLGKSFNEVADLVSVAGWRHHRNFSSEVVAEVLEPFVVYRGVPLRFGRVVMGAPPEEETIEVTSTSGVEQSLERREE